MRSSDTPESDPRLRHSLLLPHDSPLLLRGEQGPTDWRTQPGSDDLLSGDARARLQHLFEVERDADDLR